MLGTIEAKEGGLAEDAVGLRAAVMIWLEVAVMVCDSTTGNAKNIQITDDLAIARARRLYNRSRCALNLRYYMQGQK